MSTPIKLDKFIEFTENFDYDKRFYIVQLESNEMLLCWPNAGMMHPMDGSRRSFSYEDNIQVCKLPEDWYTEKNRYYKVTKTDEGVFIEPVGEQVPHPSIIELKSAMRMSDAIRNLDRDNPHEVITSRTYTFENYASFPLVSDGATPPQPKQKPPKPIRQCMLPVCRNMSTPGKLYCCADHSRAHDRLLKSQRRSMR